MENRREFIKKVSLGATGVALGTSAFSAKSYGSIMGANDRVRVGIVGFSDRFKASLLPGFLDHNKNLNFEFTAISDIWTRRREEGAAEILSRTGKKIKQFRNNEELYASKEVDAVIISTADFQHALHAVEAVTAGCDAYVEKPFAESMEDARAALKAVNESKKIVQIGSQRRSGANYIAANDYIRAGKFGDIMMVELLWNVNQPGRWRRPQLVSEIKKEDVDWDRFQMNRPKVEWDPRKYLEYRLFWPYSSGIPGQWMCHQIDTVHWFTGLDHPRSAVANGGIYLWNDGRQNADTMTVVFDYGPSDNMQKGFQATFSSRFTNSAGGTKELYYSNGGMMNLDTNKITPDGGLTEREASAMGMKANLLQEFTLPSITVASGANTGGDPLTSAHMLNWMECVRSRKTPNASVRAGYNHAIACVMTNAAYRTGLRVTFDEKTQEVMAGGQVWKGF